MPDINLLEIDDTNTLSFDMGEFEQLNGVLVLSQWIVKLLLEDPNDPMAPAGAVGLHKLIYEPSTPNIDVKITDKINHIEDFIKARQERKNFNDPEELDRIDIRDIRINQGDQGDEVAEIFIEMDVINKNENRSRVSLPIGD